MNNLDKKDNVIETKKIEKKMMMKKNNQIK
jgi:hypothetical protein